MRISTSNFYDVGTSRISELQIALGKTQQQLATGSKILTPSDDPVGAARVIELSQAQSQNDQYAINRRNASSSLSQSENILSSTSAAIQDLQSIVVGAGGGSLTDSDRRTMAADISSRLDQLIALANSTDESGNYIYSGFKSTTQPFSKTPSGATYNGDQGQRIIQTDSSRQLPSSDSGDQIFQGGSSDVFKTLTDLVTLLNTPVATPADKAAFVAGLKTGAIGLSSSLDNVLTARASIGSRQREIDSSDASGLAKEANIKQSISSLQDVDYVSAITQLTQQKTMLEAAQQSFVKVSGLSLFNYIN
jgi:flagellar hook-associated protein 3 FlgL